jgi:hypothetical protein
MVDHEPHNNAEDSRTPRHQQLDRLIDWYDKFKPGEVTEIPLGVTRSTVMGWGIRPKERGGPIVYRDRLLKPKPKSN